MVNYLQIHEPGQSPMPHEETLAVGIDLGTTNSLVAISDKGTRQVIRDVRERALLPSIVAYGKDGSIIVGQDAAALLGEESVHVVSSIKRLMGRGKEDLKEIAGTLPYEIDDKSGGMVSLMLAGRSVTPVEISAEILKSLKARAEHALEHEVTKAVITVPAYFDDAARTATKDAARLAGIEVLRLLNEPTAAALAYGLDNAAEGVYAVYDLGGGTFDISLLKMEKGVFKVLATGGDAALGGDDFDDVIAEHFVSASGLTEKLNPRQLAQLLVVARKVKEELTQENSTRMAFDCKGKTFAITLDKATLEKLISQKVSRTISICREVMEDANLSNSEINGVVMVGGSTRVPLVRSKVAEFFKSELYADVDPDKVVALGAAVQAEALTRGGDTLLLDVTPLSLGIETMGKLVEKIIHRNTPIPVARAQEFTTYEDGQSGMMIHILQGEREMVSQCRSLAQFELKGIPPMPAGIPKIKITFTIDADGLLKVSAREETTGVEQQIEVKPSYGLPVEKIEQMLRESIDNAREDIRERLLVEARVEADVMCRTVESAIAKDGDLLDNSSREKIEAQIVVLKKAMQGTDRDTIDIELRELEKVAEDFADKRVNRALTQAMKGKSVSAVEGQMTGDKKTASQ
jgi:molecular chaperone HscA